MNHIQEETERLRAVIKFRATIKPYEFKRGFCERIKIWVKKKFNVKVNFNYKEI